MLKKILLAFLALVVILIVLEVVALLHERGSVAKFAEYWTSQNRTATGTLTYVALGDSAAQGIGTKDPTHGYVGLLAARIEQQTGQKVRLINLSVTGARIKDVTTKQLPQLAQYKPDIVTVEIGGNDVVHYDNQQFTRDFQELTGKLPKGTYISDMPFFGGRIAKNREALQAGTHIYDSVATNQLRLVPLQKFTRERDSILAYAPDCFHPSDRGYRNWADAFWSVIQPDLTQPPR